MFSAIYLFIGKGGFTYLTQAFSKVSPIVSVCFCSSRILIDSSKSYAIQTLLTGYDVVRENPFYTEVLSKAHC